MPRNYTSRHVSGYGWSIGDREIDLFEAYDLHMRQTHPLLIVVDHESEGSDGGTKDVRSDSKLVCLRPNHIAEGSHDPDSSAGVLLVNWATVWGLVVVTIITTFVL